MSIWFKRHQYNSHEFYDAVPYVACTNCGRSMYYGVCPKCVQRLLDTLLLIVRHPEQSVDLAELALEDYYKVEPDEVTEQMQRAVSAIHEVARKYETD